MNLRIRTTSLSSDTFDLANPNWDALSSGGIIANSLSRQTRFNGHANAKGNDSYSVAQHAVLVTTLAYRLGVRDKEILKACLHHDDVESVTGDIVTPLSALIPELKKFIADLEFGYKSHRGLVGIEDAEKIVKKCDKLMYAHEVNTFFCSPFSIKSDVTELNLIRLNKALENSDLYQSYVEHSHLMDPIMTWNVEIARDAYLMLEDWLYGPQSKETDLVINPLTICSQCNSAAVSVRLATRSGMRKYMSEI